MVSETDGPRISLSLFLSLSLSPAKKFPSVSLSFSLLLSLTRHKHALFLFFRYEQEKTTSTNPHDYDGFSRRFQYTKESTQYTVEGGIHHALLQTRRLMVPMIGMYFGLTLSSAEYFIKSGVPSTAANSKFKYQVKFSLSLSLSVTLSHSDVKKTTFLHFRLTKRF